MHDVQSRLHPAREHSIVVAAPRTVSFANQTTVALAQSCASHMPRAGAETQISAHCDTSCASIVGEAALPCVETVIHRFAPASLALLRLLWWAGAPGVAGSRLRRHRGGCQGESRGARRESSLGPGSRISIRRHS